MSKYWGHNRIQKLKGEKGSVTLFVLIAMIFFLTIGITVYIANVNQKQSQEKEINKIQYEYGKNNDLNTIYNEQVDKVQQKLLITVIDSVGNKYIEKTWTNKIPLTVKVNWPDGTSDANKVITVKDLEDNVLADKLTENEINTQEILSQSCILTTTLNGTDVSVKILVDTTDPTINISPNSGTYLLADGETKRNIPTDGMVTVTDTQSGVATKEYVWTTSTEQPQDGWTGYNDAKEIGSDSENPKFGKGTYYLHIKATDEVGNINYACSEEFRVMTKEEAQLYIRIVPETEEWTKNDVNVNIYYDTIFKDNSIKRAGFGTTEEAAKSNASIINSTKVVATENGWVYAEAQVDSGDYVSNQKQITNIDREAPSKPVIESYYKDGSGNYTSGTWTNKQVTTKISSEDTQSGVKEIQYSFDKTTWTKLEFNQDGIVKNENTYYGVYDQELKNRDDVLYFKAIDNVGNESEISEGFNIKYDITPPTLEITSSAISDPTKENSITYTFTFSEDVADFTKDDINVTNGTKGEFSVSGSTYTLVVTDGETGTQKVEVPANKCIDKAGNGNTEASKTINIDKTGPKVTFGTNGNTTYAKSQSTTVTIEDIGASGVNSSTLKYQWTQSTTAPEESSFGTTFKSGDTVTKPDGDGNNWYLWILAKDNLENTTITRSNAFYLDNTEPRFTNYEIKNLSTTGYDVYVYGVADACSGVNRVQFPTWTEANGNDDVQENWETNSKATGVKQSDGTTWVYRVNVTDHNNEYGNYITHVYVYDNLGNSTCIINDIKQTVPAVNITYDNNYLENNLWTDTDDLAKYKSAGTTSLSNKTRTQDTSVMNGYINEFTMNAGTSGGVYYVPSAKLTAGKTYTWSAYVKTSSSKTLKIGQEQNGQKTVNITTSWQKITHTYTAVDNTNGYYAFVFYVTGGSTWTEGDKLYIHSLEIKEGDSLDISTVQKGYGAALGTLSTPTRTGYTFAGWFTAPTGGTQISSTTTVPASDTTYYAHWTINSYNVTFSADGINTDFEDETKQYMYNERLGTLPTPTKVGYTLQGWFTELTGGTQISSETRVPASDVKYYSQWIANTYTVEYNGNGATGGSTASSTHTYDVAKKLTANGYTREYTVTYNHNYSGSSNTSKTSTYTFAGWATSASGNVAYSNSQSVKNLTSTNGATVTLYAKWNGASVNYTPTRTGYTFGGWYKEAECTNKISDATYTPTANITVYAKWTANTYTVSYNGNGATGGSTANSTHTYDVAKKLTANGYTREYTVTYNHNYSGSSNTSKTSTYSFAGWATSASGNVAYSNSQSVKNLTSTNGATVTLYAKWNSASVNYTPTRTGYTFGGWYKEAECTNKISDATYTPTANITVYAKWTANTYTVSYNGNGATGGSTASSTHTYDVAKNLTANGYTRAYTVTYNHNYSGSSNTSKTATYSFAGWATSASGNVAYSNSQSVKNLTSTNGATVTLYANWSSASVSYTPTRTGYTFGGWYKEAECTNKISDATYTPTANITVYAKWTANTYTVSYNGNGATGGSTANSSHTYDVAKNLTANGYTRAYTVTYNHNYSGSTDTSKTATYTFNGWATSASGEKVYNNEESVTNLSAKNGATVTLYAKWNSASVSYTPTRTGYTFGGWYKEAECTNKVSDATYTPTGNITVYAKWTPNTYTVSYNGNGATGGSTASSTHTYNVAKNLTANGYTRAYTVTYNHNYSGSTNTSKTATYTFAGWAISTSGNVAYNNSQSVTNLTATNGATVTLYAKWNSASVSYTPTRTGYIFGGWYKEAACTNKVSDATYTPTGNITVYAKWTPITYTVKYDGNGATGGSTANSSHTYNVAKNLTANGYTRAYTVTYNHNYSGSTNTSKTATYTFAGWAISTSGNVAYNNSQSVTNLTATNGATVTLYAKWNSASVSYTPTRTGYIFGGWYKEAACTNKVSDATYTPTGNITVYAKWTPITYTVKYDGNGATGGSTANSSHTYNVAKNLTANGYTRAYTVTYNHNYSGSTNTSKTATYTFAGWAISTSGNVAYNNSQSVTNLTATNGATVTLYAKWNSASVSYTPTRTGYIFGGWYKEAACTNKVSDATYKPTGNITVYAKWTPITYTVKYDGNGATGGSTTSSTHTYNVEKNLTANKFTRAYTVTYNHNYSGSTNTSKIATYTFNGWATSASGEKVYNNAQSVKNLTSTNGATVTLYANWSSASVSYTPTRTGYIFGGWYKEASCTNKVTDATYTPTANITLYAKWTEANYSVTTSNGTYYYLTLADAVSKADTSGSTITVLKNYTDSSSVTIEKNLTINTNGKTLTMTNTIQVKSSYKLQIKGNGSIVGSSYTINNAGTLTISGGTIKSTGNPATIKNSGNLTISGGNVYNNSTTGGYAIIASNNSNISITGGYIHSNSSRAISLDSNFKGSFTMNGGTITAGSSDNSGSSTNGAIYNNSTNNVVLNLYKGTINSYIGTAIYQGGTGKLTINMGVKSTISGTSMKVSASNSKTYYYAIGGTSYGKNVTLNFWNGKIYGYHSLHREDNFPVDKNVTVNMDTTKIVNYIYSNNADTVTISYY